MPFSRVSALWNANRSIQDLNSDHQVYFQWYYKYLPISWGLLNMTAEEKQSISMAIFNIGLKYWRVIVDQLVIKNHVFPMIV